jgi:hypothetical protein
VALNKAGNCPRTKGGSPGQRNMQIYTCKIYLLIKTRIKELYKSSETGEEKIQTPARKQNENKKRKK